MSQNRFHRNKREGIQRVNHRIRVPEVRVIDSDGAMLGVMKTGQALALARSKGLDLVEVAAQARPPTCKIIDHGKLKYVNKKKEKVQKKNKTTIQVKEIRLRPNTGSHDVDIRIKRAREFLEAGCKVHVTLRFVGREMAHKNIGYKVMQSITEKLKDVAIVEEAPKDAGRSVFTIFAPIQGPSKSKKKKSVLTEKVKATDSKEPDSDQKKVETEKAQTTSSKEPDLDQKKVETVQEVVNQSDTAKKNKEKKDDE